MGLATASTAIRSPSGDPPIRPLERGDLAAVAAIYADFNGWDVEATVPDLERFFVRLLYEDPWADPEVGSLVYDDPDDGVIGVRCIHQRRFVYNGRRLRVACAGPMAVHRDHRRKRIATRLVRRYFEGPQDMSAGDRAIDAVHGVWEREGTTTYTAASIGWSRLLAPGAFVTGHVLRRPSVGGRARAVRWRERPPGDALLSRLDKAVWSRLEPPPPGSIEPLTNATMIDMVERLEHRFPLRPDYDEPYLTWLFDTMARVNVGVDLVRRLVRRPDGTPAGHYVLFVNPRWRAHVIQLAAAGKDVGLVLDHMFHDAAERGAVEVQGRFEPHLVPHLRTRRCFLVRPGWAHVNTGDSELLAAVLAGRSLLTRLDGEWWMRPRPFVA